MPEQSYVNKRKVAIIGAGTGLTCAWALDPKRFDVTVFEERARLGGHINSVEINGVIIEAGAEFIGPPEPENPSNYQNTHRLLNHLGVKLEPFQLSMDFHDLRTNEHTILPPIYKTSDGKDEDDDKANRPYCNFFPCLKKNQPEIEVSFSTLFFELCRLFNINKLIQKAKEKLLKSHEVITLEEFVEGEFSSPKYRKFLDEMLYPMIAAGWGVAVDMIKTFCAHFAMLYLAAGDTWYDAVDGLSSYIYRMAGECQADGVKIKTETPIQKLVPVTVNGQTKYQLLKKDGSLVLNDENQPIIYDDVIMATPAYATKELIADIQHEAIAPLCHKLHQVLYFDTTVVFHQDPEYLSENNTVIHSRFDGKVAANTVCKNWKFKEGEMPILKTWVLPGQPMPKNILEVVHYKHPYMTKNYYAAQRALHKAQGAGGLWFGGILAGRGDSHEGALTGNLEVGARMNDQENCLQDNARLHLFPDIIEKVRSGKLLNKHYNHCNFESGERSSCTMM